MPFEPFKEQINLAFALCRGRVLEDPRRLTCSEILHITPPEDFVTFGTTIQRYMLKSGVNLTLSREVWLKIGHSFRESLQQSINFS
jgi:hypothetical protein